MLQQDEPEDYVIGTGEAHSVREFVELAFGYAGFEVVWEGSGLDEKGYDRKTGKLLVEVDPRFFRPAEVHHLLADPSKAKDKLGWEPKVLIKDLVKMMVESDLELCQKMTT